MEIKKSSSIEQQEAEDIIFSHVENILMMKLQKNEKIFLKDNSFTYIQPDFYSESECVVGEIFAHVGKPKKAQDNKIANDILKMLLLEKICRKKYRKIIVVCDKEEEKKLRGSSALAESIRQFEIEVMVVDIDKVLKNKIVATQKRQKMINFEELMEKGENEMGLLFEDDLPKVKKKKEGNTTVAGYINKNGQENLGCLHKAGTHANQTAYQMKCHNCGHVYEANGCDIFLRKCPKCM